MHTILDNDTLKNSLVEKAYTTTLQKNSLKKITEEYIDYNRRDVLATLELSEKLLTEYGRHPINLQPTKAYSPASIGKAYLRAMGITPILDLPTSFPGCKTSPLVIFH